MAQYIENYLSVLPEYQKKEISKMIRERERLISKENVSEQEFINIVNKIENRKSSLQELKEISKDMSSREYNLFLELAKADFDTLYQEIILLESANANFNDMYDSIISDIQSSLVELIFMSDNLVMERVNQNSTQVIKQRIRDYSSMESIEEHPSLFTDRNGEEISPIGFSESFHNKYGALPIEEETDALRFKGKLVSQISIDGRVGIPSNLSSSGSNNIHYAVDDSEDTYFEEVFYLEEPMKNELVLKSKMNLGGRW